MTDPNLEIIYLDNAASTPVTDEVFDEMIPYLKLKYGNPSSIHKLGRETSRALELARRRIAAVIGANSREIIFTSGGTEADNLAIKGAALCAKRRNPFKEHIITTTIEHEAVLEPCRDLEKNGFKVSYVPVSKEGLVNTAYLENILDTQCDCTAIVSVMYANNEVGTVQPIAELATIAHKAGALFHTDAVQALGKIRLGVNTLGTDLMSISSHKINGPKGVGALYVRQGVELDPVIHGGGQESLLRSGTENVHGIVGFGKACEIVLKRLEEYKDQVSKLRDYLVGRLVKEIPNCRLNGPLEPASRLPNNAHFTFFGVSGEDLIIKLDEYGIAASTGSACSVKKQKASHVLKALGFSYEEISGSLRISLGIQNTKEEIDRTVCVLSEVIRELRIVSPFKGKYD